jgi:tRNA(adenine34) deaminase
MKTPEEYMKAALKEAAKAEQIDEVPVGAVIVQNGTVIAKAHNLREKTQMASAHAELLAIQKASNKLGTWCLEDCDLYVTLEPCLMCTGAIELSRIHALYYGTSDPKGGSVDTLIQVKKIPHLNTYPKEIHTGILQKECSEILTSFFQEKRKKAKQKKVLEKAEKR